MVLGPDGEIGRHKGLKIPRPQGCTGSIPVPGTIFSSSAAPMIIFDLRCSNTHRFEGWFASTDAFEQQLAKGLVTCPACHSPDVQRVPSAVHVATKTAERPGAALKNAPSPTSMVAPPSPATVARQLVKALLATSENVGKEFAAEARRIHHEEAPPRAIHGQATEKECEALQDEGINVLRVPNIDSDGLN